LTNDQYARSVPDSQLTTSEAARRLGVKPATLYAYVSRGLLRSHLADDGRTSRFDAAEVERLAGRGRRSRRRAGTGLDVVLATSITRLDGHALRYRGLDPVELVRSHPFEAVARLLWGGELDPAPMVADPAVVAAATAAQAALPDTATFVDRLRVIATVAAAADPFRADLSAAGVGLAGEHLLATFAGALPRRGRPAPALVLGGHRHASSLAATLWPRLTARRADAASVRALNTALVLLADHELAVSTLAVRVAASGRVDPYACATTGLGAIEGLLHGASGRRTYELFERCERPRDAPRVVGELLRDGRRVPGFGHVVYVDDDPRVPPILDAVRAAAVDRRRLAVVDAVVEAASARTPVTANVELAVAALAFTAHMPSDGSDLVFALARTAGWLAHALEEYGEPPLRFRGRAVYVGR
jgi:citrate synthase